MSHDDESSSPPALTAADYEGIASHFLARLADSFRRTGGGAPTNFEHTSFFNGSPKNVKKTVTNVKGWTGKDGATPQGVLTELPSDLAPNVGTWVGTAVSSVKPTRVVVNVENSDGKTAQLSFDVPDITNASPQWFVAYVTHHVDGADLVATVVMVKSTLVRIERKSAALK